MGYYCCVPLCNSNSKRKNGVSFHGFTKDKQLRIKWLQNIRRDVNSKTNPFRINHHTKICSLHFLKSDFKIASEKWRLKPNAVPSIFAWTGNKPNKNVIKVPTFVPKSQPDDDDNSDGENEELFKIETETQESELDKISNIKIEGTESITDNKQEDKPATSQHEETEKEDYKQMYYALLKENRYFKSELETINYKYKDQEDLYENLVVVNKTTQKENAELRHTVAILQACLKKTTIFHEPSTIYLTHPTLPRDEKMIIQQQQQFQQQYQQLLQHQHQLQLMQHRQMQQTYQTIQSKEKNVAELQKTIVNQQLKYFEMVQGQQMLQAKKQQKMTHEVEHHNMLQKLLEGDFERFKKRKKSSNEEVEKERKNCHAEEVKKGKNQSKQEKCEEEENKKTDETDTNTETVDLKETVKNVDEEKLK